MKKLYVLLSSLALVFVMQSVSLAADESNEAGVEKPTVACAKCGRVCTCKPKEDKYSHYPESEEEKAYKEYMRQIGAKAEAEHQQKQ